ncbi:dynein regulatory complex subunit 7 isoform X2 [Echeneis naucrates]|uniref:dynein regulatory complex subunit 7 isoform X2 n=1 Tax=Echeneis naucrates TaxID=173247 RepID=UPI0011140922|nr:dynein regulatory complex subunit 7 isoform X2 [Echeneis naucrates]
MEAVVQSDREERLRNGDAPEDDHEDDHEEDGQQLEQHLSHLNVSAPPQLLITLDSTYDSYPESYKTNSPDELQLLAIVENFQHQYFHLYPDHKPLLLCPVNEFGVKKFVSTTLRPTLTAYPELFSWEGSASFVADFLSLDHLEPPVDLPRYLFSSTSVLQTRRATCFEFATLLCSLLLGADYDAYCVSGYATKELCLLDQSLQDCPLLDTKVHSVISEDEQQENKYTVKPLKELKSHFLREQERKKHDAEAALLQEQRLQEESEYRLPDPLRGLRVHCWVLVLAGSRGVFENFFIDPLTGISYSTASDNFLGIESVWNNLSYYVNMQDCSNGCSDMVYDLEDLNLWEPILFSATGKKQLILDAFKEREMKMMSKMNEDGQVEREPWVFQMPRSWVSFISISKKDLEDRWPGRQKVTHYRRAKLERCSAYLRPDGLVTRLTTYKDLDCTEVTMVKEWYQHRTDHLEERELNKVDNFTTERFKQGRSFHLLSHRFRSQRDSVLQEMEFSDTRVGHLVQRIVSPGQMTETFRCRPDFLHCRHVVFEQPVQFSEQPELTDQEAVVLQVVEHFHRDRSKPANEDVAERVFLPAQRRIDLTYHLEDHRFIPSKRSFIKPQQAKGKEKAAQFTSNVVSGFQVDPTAKPLSTKTLYEMLMALMVDEATMSAQVEESTKEVSAIVACREREETNIELNFSPWSTAGAARARALREEKELLALEEQKWLQEEDVLTPILIRLDNPETLSNEDAKQLYHDCMAEFKNRLVEQANLMQERYAKDTQELQSKQLWYHKNQHLMTEDDEREYQAFCSEKTLKIRVTESRLRTYGHTDTQKFIIINTKR